MSVGGDNVVDAAQVRATTAAVTKAHAADGRSFPPVIGVDQEGGVVAHLDGIATTFPPFQEAGDAIAAGPRQGNAVVRNGRRLHGHGAADARLHLGVRPRRRRHDRRGGPHDRFPVAVAGPEDGAPPRSGPPCPGYDEAGVVSTTKHFPGHGSVTADSHEVLPRLDASLETLRQRDLVPFEAAVDAGAPAIMMGHLDARALAARRPDQPGAGGLRLPARRARLRGRGDHRLAWAWVAVMRPGKPAVDAINAGADLLLMPPDTRNTHAVVTEAIENGEIPRERVEEAAARVVALQLWQQRQADAVPLPAPAVVTRHAQAAAAALDAAGE